MKILDLARRTVEFNTNSFKINGELLSSFWPTKIKTQIGREVEDRLIVEFEEFFFNLVDNIEGLHNENP